MKKRGQELTCQIFCIKVGSSLEGLMMISTAGFSRLHLGKELVYIEFLATAPWNRTTPERPKRYRGVGGILMEAAIRLSLDFEFGGRIALGRAPTADENDLMLAHWQAMTLKHRALKMEATTPPLSVVREAVEENTGEKFKFTEPLYAYRDFKPDIDPAALDAETRGLAEVCLTLFNSNEFAYLY